MLHENGEAVFQSRHFHMNIFEENAMVTLKKIVSHERSDQCSKILFPASLALKPILYFI